MAMTYVEALEQAIAICGEGEVAEKLTALKAQVAKKRSSSKPTKTQVENENLKDKILEVLANADKSMTATEIGEALGVSVNKASALLSQLKEDNSVVREVVKRKAYFTKA